MATPVVESYNGGSGASTSAVVTKPTGLAEGDLLLVIIGAKGSSTPSAENPTGWTQLLYAQNVSNKTSIDVSYKIADSSDVAASNFTFTAVNGVGTQAFLMRISGMSSTAPVSDSQITHNSTTFSLTPGTATSLLILAGVQVTASGSGWSGYTISGTNPTWTEIYDNSAQLYFGVAKATANSVSEITSANVLEGGANDEYRILLSISEVVPGTLTLDAVEIPVVVNDFTFEMSGTLTLDAVEIPVVVPEITLSETTANSTNTSKNSAQNILNTPKS